MTNYNFARCLVSVVIFFLFFIISACDIKPTTTSQLHHTWACGGISLSQTGETFYPSGRYSMYSHVNTSEIKQGIYEGQYQLVGDRLTLLINRIEKTKSATIRRDYKVINITARVLELKLLDNENAQLENQAQNQAQTKIPAKIKSCRSIVEKQLGSYYQLALKKFPYSAKLSRIAFSEPKGGANVLAKNKGKAKIKSKNAGITLESSQVRDFAVVTLKNNPNNGNEINNSLKQIEFKSEKEKYSPNNLATSQANSDEQLMDLSSANEVQEDVFVLRAEKLQQQERLKKNSHGVYLNEYERRILNSSEDDDLMEMKIANEFGANQFLTNINIEEDDAVKSYSKFNKERSHFEGIKNVQLSMLGGGKNLISDDNEIQFSDSLDQETIAKIKSLLKIKKNLLFKAKALDYVYRNKSTNYQVIKAMSNSITTGLSLFSIHKRGSYFKISGTTLRKKQIDKFIYSLSKSSFVSNVHLVSISQSGKQKEFSIRFRQRKIHYDYDFISLKSIYNNIDALTYHRSQNKELMSIYKLLMDSMPNKRQTFAFIRDVSLVGREFGLKVSQPIIKNRKKEGWLVYYPVEIEAVGDYKAYMKFVNTLASMRFATKIESLSMLPLKGKFNPQLRIKLRLNVYTHLKENNIISVKRKSSPLKFIKFTPYKVVQLDNHGIMWNPFVRIKGKIKSYCDGPFDFRFIGKTKLVKIINKIDRIAILESNDGRIYRARLGTCIAKNTRVSSIFLHTIKIRQVQRSRTGRYRVKIHKLKLKTHVVN